MKAYYINDKFVVENEQTVFRTNLPIIENAILVYKNGILVNKDTDYVVEDNYTIAFKDILTAGETVNISSILNNEKITMSVVTSNNYSNSSLFKKYGTTTKLKLNSTYLVNINVKNENINWRFSTKLSPLLSTIKKIRLDTGGLLEGMDDEKIIRMIYLNSKECIEKYNETLEDSYSTSTTLPKYLNTWVRYKTDLDLCYAVYLTLTGKSGSVSKKIGVIEIENQIKLPYLSDMLSEFKKKFEDVDNSLKKANGSVLNFVKAKNNAYPINGRMQF